MTKKQLIKAAKLEIDRWHDLPPGLVMAILFSFVHFISEGETVEETFFKKKQPELDYEI
jgi:hypothetical protein